MAGGPIAIVGGGIVGLALARRLGSGGEPVVVVEKEDRIAVHQTGHNSGVVHSGVYYTPGSLKARLTRRGLALLKSYCEEHDLPYVSRGKLIIAVSGSELPRLDELERRGHENGLVGLERLSGDRLTEVEPAVTGVAGLHVPETAVADYPAVARKLAEEVEARGGRILTGRRVRRIVREQGGVRLELEDGEGIAAASAVACAGQGADLLARAGGAVDIPRIVPFFGRYWDLAPEHAAKIRGLIYPVPDPRYPFLGVHFTRGVDDSVRVGPGAIVALGREAYGRSAISWGDTRDMLASGAFWRMAGRHWRTGVKELGVFASTSILARQASAYLPGIETGDLRVDGGGIRAQAVDARGNLLDDFVIHGSDRIYHVLNAPSPAATASLAIADELADRLAAAGV